MHGTARLGTRRVSIPLSVPREPGALQGFRILCRVDGLSYIEPPCYRHIDGDLVPALMQPEELEYAIARAVLERFGGFVIASTSRPHEACRL